MFFFKNAALINVSPEDMSDFALLLISVYAEDVLLLSVHKTRINSWLFAIKELVTVSAH